MYLHIANYVAKSTWDHSLNFGNSFYVNFDENFYFSKLNRIESNSSKYV